MNQQFTEALGRWLEQPAKERDYAAGAKMLYQLNGNAILYRNISFNPARHAERIEYELRKHYTPRAVQFTHEMVERMQKKADEIVQIRRLEKPAAAEIKAGKRGDHDKLPEEIQKLYTDNLSILHRMRDVQTRLRILSEDNEGKFCPDSDRYPYLVELISLDETYRANWARYDDYEPEGSEPKPAKAADAREKSKRAMRLVNLNKGRYKRQPSDELAAQIRDWYDEITTPPAKLTAELEELGIL